MRLGIAGANHFDVVYRRWKHTLSCSKGYSVPRRIVHPLFLLTPVLMLSMYQNILSALKVSVDRCNAICLSCVGKGQDRYRLRRPPFFLMPPGNCFFPTARPWRFPPGKVTFCGSIFRLFNLDSSYVMTPIMLQGSHKWSGVRWGPRQGSWIQFLPRRCSMIITYVLVFQFLNKSTYVY